MRSWPAQAEPVHILKQRTGDIPCPLINYNEDLYA